MLLEKGFRDGFTLHRRHFICGILYPIRVSKGLPVVTARQTFWYPDWIREKAAKPQLFRAKSVLFPVPFPAFAFISI